MAKIYETLRKKNDLTIEVYPNIETPNIPDGAVTTPKINDGAITSDKLATGSVTTGKLASNSVTSGKLDSGAVTTAKISDGAVTSDKLNDNAVTTSKIVDYAIIIDKLSNGLFDMLQRLEHTYNVTLIDDDGSPTISVFLGSTTFPSQMDNYSVSDYDHAFDFVSKGGISDFNATDITILKMFIDGFSNNGYNQTGSNSPFVNRYFNGNESFEIKKAGSYYNLTYVKNNVEVFKLVIDGSTDTITSYTQKDIAIVLNKLTNDNITSYTR